jgi:hypothetical protein
MASFTSTQFQASASLADLSNDGRYLFYIVVAGGNSTLYVAELTLERRGRRVTGDRKAPVPVPAA